jgi:hypothetical protein
MTKADKAKALAFLRTVRWYVVQALDVLDKVIAVLTVVPAATVTPKARRRKAR